MIYWDNVDKINNDIDTTTDTFINEYDEKNEVDGDNDAMIMVIITITSE